MKKSLAGYHTFLLLVLFGFHSCSKNAATAGNGCIERLVLLPGDLPVNSLPVFTVDPITQAQIDSIKTLFSQNNLPSNQYQYVYFTKWAVSADSIQVQVTANPFVNGLPVFADQQVFNFINGIYSPSISYITVETAANSDTAGHQSLPYLRNAFFQHISEATITGPLMNSKPTAPSAAAYADTCLWATLGYIDQSIIPGNASSPGHLIKVWRVTPSNSDYPTVFVRDDNGQGWGSPVVIP